VKSNRAFSLIELMVVIAIIAILAAIALPLYQSFSCRTKAVEALKVLTDAKVGFNRIVSLDSEFDSRPWGGEAQIERNLGIQIPNTQRWIYNSVASANTITITVQADSANVTSCLVGFEFVYEGTTENLGLTFRVADSNNTNLIATTNFTGRL